MVPAHQTGFEVAKKPLVALDVPPPGAGAGAFSGPTMRVTDPALMKGGLFSPAAQEPRTIPGLSDLLIVDGQPAQFSPETVTWWNGLDPATQNDIISVADVVTEEYGDEPFFELLNTSDGRERLLDTDAEGNTTLSNLAGIATSPLYPGDEQRSSLEGERERILNGVVMNVHNPEWVYQNGPSETCTMASTEFALFRWEPAEATRIMEGLVTDGTVTLRGGVDLSLAQDVIPDETINQGFRMVDYIFQGAGMALVHSDPGYSPAAWGDLTHGAEGTTWVPVMDAAFGTQFSVTTVGVDPADRQGTIADLEAQVLAHDFSAGPLFLAWYDQNSGHMVTVTGYEQRSDGQLDLTVQNTLLQPNGELETLTFGTLIDLGKTTFGFTAPQ